MPEITQRNLYLLLPSKVSWLADYLAHDKGLSVVEAIKNIYSSNVYRRLEQESTKNWHLGPSDLYSDLKAGV